jgi:hypothetical protein
VNDSKHLFDLDVMTAVAAWTANRKPVGVEVAAEPLLATSVSVDVDGGAMRCYETDAIPVHRK